MHDSLLPPDEQSPEPTPQPNTPKKRNFFLCFQILQIFNLFVTYSATYLSFSVLSIAAPLITEDPHSNIQVSQISIIFTVTKIVRFVPKLLSGLIVDFLGGKRMFLIGELLSGLCLCLLAIGAGFWYVLIFWVLSQIFNVVVYPAMVKMTSNWVHYKKIGTVLGILSQSYLVGDALSRLYLAAFVQAVSWKILFLIAGGSLIIFVIYGFLFLRNSPEDLGYPEPKANPANLLGKEGETSKMEGNVLKTFLPIFLSPEFWLIAIQYILLSMNRYILADWIPTFMRNKAQASQGISSLASTLFPIAGVFSAIFMGFVVDRWSSLKRNITVIMFETVFVILSFVFWLLTWNYQVMNIAVSMVFFALLGFTMNGQLPMSAMSVLYGGKKANATINGIFDGLGTLGSALSGVLGLIFLDAKKPTEGWNHIILVFTISALAATVATCIYAWVDWRRSKKLENAQPVPDEYIRNE